MTTDYHQRIGNRLAQQSARVRSDAAAIGAEADAEIARLQAQVDALADALERLSAEAAEGLNSCITRDSNGHAQWAASFSENIARARAALAAAGR